MPFEISLAINAPGKLRKLIEKTRRKKILYNEKGNETKNTQNILYNVEKSNQQTDKISYKKPNYVTVYTNTESTIDNLVFPYNDMEKEKGETSNENESSFDKELILNQPSSDVKVSPKDKLYVIDSGNTIPGCLKKLFMTSRKKQEATEDGETGEKQACDSAIDAFSTLLTDESSLNALVGKEFILKTIVTIKGIEDDGQPNLILAGSIPFRINTENGVKEKKVRVTGKLYSPRKETSFQTLHDESKTSNTTTRNSASSTQYLTICKINEEFKQVSSFIRQVDWFTSKVFTQEEYEKHISSLTPESIESLMDNNLYIREDSYLEGVEQHRHVSDFDEKEKSLNFIEQEQQKHKSNVLRNTTDGKSKLGSFNDMKLPVTSITITRSKTRLIKFTDGTNFTQKVGRNVVTLSAPEGILYFPRKNIKDMTESDVRIIPSESLTAIQCGDNGFTSSCFQVSREDNFVKSITGAKRYPLIDENRQRAKILPQRTYPPNDYSELLRDRYNPLTWIYKNFDKTKRFVQEFSVIE